MRRLFARLLVLAAVAGGVWLALPRSPLAGSAAAQVGRPAGQQELRWMGVATCSSGACHHQNEGRGRKRSEYTTWAGDDRHARAFQVLHDDRSERMVRNLYGADAAPATETKLCLQCHATGEGDVGEDRVGDRFHLGDGVGCESCHGAAERWLPLHYQAGWRERSPEERAALGFRDTKDIVTRARTCSECHVGTREKEVNHDLIAAGHPRLNFEFAAFQGNYPKHWGRGEDLARYPDFEVRSWAVGQVVSAQRALDLLQARAQGGAGEHPSKPWPEFAEYACFSCHRDLRVLPSETLEARRRAGGRPGTFPWGTWYVTMPRVFAGHTGGTGDDFRDAVVRLRERMESPSPDPSGVAREAGRALRVLDRWLDEVRRLPAWDAGEARRLMESLAGEAARRADALDWDQAAQRYLALAALHQGLGDLGSPPPRAVTDDLLAIRRRLKGAFVPGFDSPRGYDPLAGRPLRDWFLEVRTQLGP